MNQFCSQRFFYFREKTRQMKEFVVKLSSLMLLISCLSACKIKNKQLNPLEGKWNWNNSVCCGDDALQYRSDSNHLQIQLNFKKYTIDYISNGTYSKSEIYHIRKGLNDFQFSSGDTLSVVEFGQSVPAYFYIKKDTLILSRSYMEGSIDTYIRKK